MSDMFKKKINNELKMINMSKHNKYIKIVSLKNVKKISHLYLCNEKFTIYMMQNVR